MTNSQSRTRSRVDGQMLSFTHNTYPDRTSRPIYALVFLAPLIVIYEIGTVLVNASDPGGQHIRVVSFIWLQELLTYIGLDASYTSIGAPLIVIIVLLAMQITSRSPWFIKIPDLPIMLFECLIFAIPLIVLCLALNRPARQDTAAFLPTIDKNLPCCKLLNENTNPKLITLSSTDEVTESQSEPNGRQFDYSLWSIIVTGIGAGIYEELIFRLVLICLLMMLFQDIIGLSRQDALIFSVLISAVLFSLHHHVHFTGGRFSVGEPFAVKRFIFRTLAGIYFAVLFAFRGFGITAGTHAFYDVMVALMNSFMFNGES